MPPPRLGKVIGKLGRSFSKLERENKVGVVTESTGKFYSLSLVKTGSDGFNFMEVSFVELPGSFARCSGIDQILSNGKCCFRWAMPYLAVAK